MKHLKYYIPLVLGMIITLFACSCGSSSDDDEPESGSGDMRTQLVGTWVGPEVTLVLNSNGTGTHTCYGETSNFKNWKLKGNGLSAVFTSGSPKDIGREIHLARITQFTGTSFVDATSDSKYYKQ